MGMYTSAYLAYGFPIDDIDEDVLDRELKAFKDVGHLSAGDYDHSGLYLVTQCDNADLGAPETVTIPEPSTIAEWDATLNVAADALGITEHEPPAWILIADVS
jgi:hypothetical protein